MDAATSCSFWLDPTLTAAQFAFFGENGFIHFKDFIDPHTAATLRSAITKAESYLLGNGLRRGIGVAPKFAPDADGIPFLQRMSLAGYRDRELEAFLADSRFAPLVGVLSGAMSRVGDLEKDGLVINHYHNASEIAPTRFGWRTDGPGDVFFESRVQRMLNIGLHLDGCPFESGGLRVLPGTHHEGRSPLLRKKNYLIDNIPDRNEVGFDIAAGDLVVHDSRLWQRVQPAPPKEKAIRRRVVYIPVVPVVAQPKRTVPLRRFFVSCYN